MSPATPAPPVSLSLRLIEALSEVDRAAWDRLANPPGAPANPFLRWDFLQALEASGCAAPQTGWAPRHLLAEDAAGRLVGAVPLYLKAHSRGEYVFDQGWAEAYGRIGGAYYPKLQSAVPFTPVTGPRLLAPDPAIREAMLDGLVALARRSRVSSLHVTFPTEGEWALAGEMGLLQRLDIQFQWRNRGYASYEAFLADLASRKRKALRKERAAAQDGVRIVRLRGDELKAEHWDAMFAFYQHTGARKWGAPYLNRDFFQLLHDRMRGDVVLILAEHDGDWIAGALNLLGGDAIYGRYWGCLEMRPNLHFEICYHQAIELAIEAGLDRVEAGAQGEHKLARGYAPTPVRSFHWIADPRLAAAVADYLGRERPAVLAEIEALACDAPFRRDGAGRPALPDPLGLARPNEGERDEP